MTARENVPVLVRLQADASRFGFDAALRLLMQAARRGTVSGVARLSASSALSYPAAAVETVDMSPPTPHVKLGLPGLVGAGGVLPRHYSSLLAQGHGATLGPLLDMLGDGMLAALAQAGVKYRLDRSIEAARFGPRPGPSMAEAALLAIAGFGGPAMMKQLRASSTPVLYYAGLFADRPRSAGRIAALAADWLGHPVTVVEFAGGWLEIGDDQQTALPRGHDGGAHCRLGVDATIGTRAWAPQARIILQVGPVSRDVFDALLPGRQDLKAFVALIRTYLGLRMAFAIRLVLKAPEVPAVCLSASDDPGPRLGWNTWLARSALTSGRDAGDACFDAETIERHAGGEASQG